jgi:hypothetical protein
MHLAVCTSREEAVLKEEVRRHLRDAFPDWTGTEQEKTQEAKPVAAPTIPHHAPALSRCARLPVT